MLLHSVSGQPLATSDVTAYEAKLKTLPGVGSVAPPTVSSDRATAAYTVTMSYNPQSTAAVTVMKSKLRPGAHAAAPAGTYALVGGTTAVFADIQRAVNHDYAVVFPVAALIILVILMLLLRSLVAPWYLMLSVGLGFGATLGASVLVFQGLAGQAGLVFLLPVYMYLFVVALGTDYNILMIARLREQAKEGMEPRQAVAVALQHAGPTIGAAGLILAGTFASLTLAGNTILSQLGFAVSCGIALAAFVMAMFFSPSLTTLIGRRAWWPGHADQPRRQPYPSPVTLRGKPGLPRYVADAGQARPEANGPRWLTRRCHKPARYPVLLVDGERTEDHVRTILVVGGGYAGFYTAWKLEKKLRRDEARVVVVDPRPYMTYQPFLPEVLAGSIEARHAAVSLRRHLRRTRLISGTVTAVDHAHRTATVQPAEGPEFTLGYDIIVVTAGAVTRRLAVPGVAEQAIGMKHVEEAVAIRDRLLTAFDRASTLRPGPRRQRLLTVTFAGGGFSGVEGFSELLSLATSLIRKYPELDPAELEFHLVEASDRILPEVSCRPGRWVVRSLESRGAHVHLNAKVVSAHDGHVVLSTGEEFDSNLIVWTVGNDANPMVRSHTDLPIDGRGMLIVRADLRVGTENEPVPDAWGAGDDAAVPDLAAGRPGAATVPNAQNAVRQGKLLARNIVATLRGRMTKPYVHHSLGTIATLGLGRGIFQYRGLVIKGFPAWLMHRGYHVLAIPSWERKIRVLAVWLTAAVFGRDIVSLAAAQDPRRAFVTEGEPVESPAQASAGFEYARPR